MAVTLKDVAERAGVSYATVSRALSGKPNIRPQTRDRVRRAAAELGYKPNRTARSLQARRSRVIGVIVSDIRYDFFPPVVRAIEDGAAAQGFGVLLCNSDERLDKERRYADLLIEEQVAGAIIAPTGQDAGPIRTLLEAGVPVVQVDRTVEEVEADSVVVDNRRAAHEATRHLLDNGYGRIGAIAGSTHATTARDRYHGFLDAIEAAGLEFDPRLVRHGTPYLDTGHRAMHDLLDLDDPPDAVFVTNHLLGAGALKALGERARPAPHDVGLVVFDDPPWASFVTPSVTAVAQPTYELGRHAVDRLLARVEDPSAAPRHTVLDTRLVVRASSRAPAAADDAPIVREGVPMI